MKTNVMKISLPVFLLLFLIQTACVKQENPVDSALISYRIKLKGADKQIDIPYLNNEDNSTLNLYNNVSGINQFWRLEKSGKFFRIISVFNQKAITVRHDSISDKWIVVQCRKGGSDHPDKQLWKIKSDKGIYKIQSKFNGYELAASEDSLQLSLEEGPGNQWKLIPASEEEIFSSEELREDIDFYIKTLEETHPNPYYKTSKDSVVKAMYATIEHAPMNITDFAILLAQTNHFFDGHTGNINSNSPNKITQYLNNGGNFFPEVTLTNNASSVLIHDSVLGTVTLFSINEIPISQILKQMSSIYNNENREYRQCLMQSAFTNNLIKICNISSPFHIIGENEKGKINFVLNGQSKQEVEQTRTQPIAADRYKYPLRSFFYEEDAIAVLQYNTCEDNRLGDMDAYLKNFMAQTKEKKIKHLFIDITSNGGGNSVNSLNLIKYIKHGNLRDSLSFKVSWKKEQFIKEIGIPTSGNVDSIGDIYIFKYGTYIPAQQDGFAENVYLLQSRFTYSAADHLSVLVKRFGLAVIAGEPTGQPLTTYIDMNRFQFPNTHLWFGCSKKYWENVGIDCPTESLCPDIPIEIGCEIPSEFPIEFLKNIIEKVKK